jgi:hypothetical protein
MKCDPRDFVFPGWLALCLLGAATGGWWLRHLQRTAKSEMVRLVQAKTERDQLAQRSPALSEANQLAIAADVAAAEDNLARARAALPGRGDEILAQRPVPATSTDAWFELSEFVEQMRALAAHRQVRLKAGERFGFATYASTGPELESLAAVHRQCLLARQLLAMLCEAGATELLAFQRERPRAPTPASAARVEESAADFFAPEERLVLRAKDLIDGELFRLEFTGRTDVLRSLLNSLAVSPLPFVVRSVEVEPWAEKTAPAPHPAGVSVPLVAQNFSKFTVVVEFVELFAPQVATQP